MTPPLSLAFVIDSVPFTADVLQGKTSLGGSESACLGLMRALQARGHHVHGFVTKLDEDCNGKADAAGVTWHDWRDFAGMNQFIEWDVVCALRQVAAFAGQPIHARMRLLWNQDLLIPGVSQQAVMGAAWALDHVVYVSVYHRAQWEQLQPQLAPLGWVTTNGYDPNDLPASSTKDPNRIIHISRPERGLGPLLAMWPTVRAKHPRAELRICRYSSMYDQGPGSWTDVCQQWDAQVQAAHEKVGGITYLGELNKTQLYQEISDAAVMWYPGVATFAETSCIAAIEAQACGTPFVGSYRGALPETVPGGVLIRGDAHDPVYQEQSVSAVLELMEACQQQTFDYRRRQIDGRTHVARYTFAVLAEAWERQIQDWFEERYKAHTRRVLDQLLHEDDHIAAKRVALELGDQATADWCDYVNAGKDQGPEDYATFAIQDPLKEADVSVRFKAVHPLFEGCTRVVDVACGNGAFAISLARAYPTITVHGLDYAEGNIQHAMGAAQRAGVADRCTFERVTVWNFDTQQADPAFTAWCQGRDLFDGLFVGEFVEHVANCTGLVDTLDAICTEGATAVYTCPMGPFMELLARGTPVHKGHVHAFQHDDVQAVWGPKRDATMDFFAIGHTPRGASVGHWIIHYTVARDRPAGVRPLETRIQRTRPMQKLTVGIITKDAENDIGRCLSSVWKIADELLVGDTGSTDNTKAIAELYGATIIDLPPVTEHPEGFAGTRNEVLKRATGDWFLWIDSDEALQNAHWLRWYLDGSIFNGFVLHQTHLYLDRAPDWDIPVRVFRNTGRVKFYGCVHEQPQDGDCNTDILPSLDIPDLPIVHLGYLTQEGREAKRTKRNLPLLKRDGVVFPDRVLGKVLQIREAVLQADTHRARQGGAMTAWAAAGYQHAVRIFVQHFDDPAHKYHKIARPWYEAALKHLGIGWEWEMAIAGKAGGMGAGHAKAERLWVRDGAECARWLAFKAGEITAGMAPPTFITDPDDVTQVVEPEAITA